MLVLLTMNLPYEPALGGASKGNRAVAEMLVGRGHSVRAIVPANNVRNHTHDSASSVTGDGLNDKVRRLQINGVEVHAVVGDFSAVRNYLREQLLSFRPDCVLVSSEDPMQLLLEEAIRYDSTRVVYIAHTPSCMPFGPSSFNKSERGSRLLTSVASIIAVSRFCAEYICKWSSLAPLHIYLPIYGQPPYPTFGHFEAGFVTIINPCKYKGIDIFLHLAQEFPHLTFAAVVSWGTTTDDLARMSALSNVRILNPTPHIETIFRSTRILVVPSLWLENFPMTIIEGMLHGIPILASNVGGIPEAMPNSKYVLPVQPIETFTNKWDENKLWIPIVPPQDLTVWSNALSELLTDRSAYEAERSRAKHAALSFVSRLSLEPLENIIATVACRPRSRHAEIQQPL